MCVGGSERFLQVIAAHLPRDLFDVDYYYCDAAPYLGSSSKHGDTNLDRLKYLDDHGVRSIKFHVQFRDLTKPTFDWVGTNFWELFDEKSYDFVFTVKSGHPEYPFHLLKIPVIESIVLPAGIDSQPAFHVLPSQYLRRIWFKMGGDLRKSCVVPLCPTPPSSSENLRIELRIPDDAIVAGFHQRADDAIFSPIPLQAFARCENHNRHFVLLGGGQKYRDQAKELRLNNVHFLPQTGDPVRISSFLNTLDIFAHGRADGETYGTVFSEAMLHGKPCLSHAVKNGDNAQPETMGPAGWFVLNQNEYDEKLELLFADPVRRKILSHKAVAHAQEYHSLESSIEDLTRLFQKLCDRPELPSSKKKIPFGISPMGFLYAGYVDQTDQIAHHVLAGQVPEEFWVEVVKFFLPKVRTFIDIGANTGIYGFVAAKECPPATKVHCFEPQPDCCRILEKTIYLNNWEQRVFIHPVGLSDQPGELTLYLAESGSGFDPVFSGEHAASNQTAPVDTLDDFAKKSGIEKIDFIKIDVEIFEQKVLAGAKEILARDRPTLFVEIVGNWKERGYLNTRYAATIQQIQSYGYALYRCDEVRGRLLHFGTIEKITHSNTPDKFHMYLCIPLEREAEIIGSLKRYLKNVNRNLMKRRILSARQKLTRSFKEKFKRTPMYPIFYRCRNSVFRALEKLRT
jgi:FkbM family methyltransferase